MTDISTHNSHFARSSSSHMQPPPLSLLPPPREPLTSRPMSQAAAITVTRRRDEDTARLDHRLARKRAPYIDVDQANHHPRPQQDLGLFTPASPTTTGGTSKGPRELICICAKEPHVPRPRNSFILYRQHYQAQVAAQHEGLANPEISKIIGEQWKKQPEEVKSVWSRLALEEKIRHKWQYPDYKYKPRRGGKGAGCKTTSASGKTPGYCDECGGRTTATPTPRTPLTPPFAVATPSMLKPGGVHPHHSPRGMEVDHFRRGSASSDMSVDSHGRRYTQPRLGDTDRDCYATSPTGIEGPELKRRRYNAGPPPNRYMPGSPSTAYPTPRTSISTSPVSAAGYGPSMQVRSLNGPPMQPPPRPSVAYHQVPPLAARAEAGFDESLRLPPLQTQLANSPGKKPEASPAWPSPAHANNGMVMPNSGAPAARPQTRPSSQLMYKLDMLHAISPPLQPPTAGAPAYETRGPVIAIEGLQPDLLKQVTAVVEKALDSSGGCGVRIWSEPDRLPLAKAADGSEHAHGAVAVGKEEGGAFSSPLATYLAKMLQWHRTSEAVVDHITHHASSGSGGGPPKLPVAVLSTGYSLSISDEWASALAITDAYRHDDHWRWVATMWRGIVGADLSIYVKRAGADEMRASKSVEFVSTPGQLPVLFLRVPEGGGGVDERLERRLGFEVMEWLRNGTFRAGAEAV